LPRLATRCPGIDASEGWPIILALIAEFENDIRRERQMDGIAKAKERGIKFGCKLELTPDRVAEIKTLRAAGTTVPDTIRQIGLSKATIYRGWINCCSAFGSKPDIDQPLLT
jgi:DNA invertase Pin-like site-specific DNA recombinase